MDDKHWWMRCSAAGEECRTIDGSESDRTHKVGRDDLGHTLKLRVFASTAEGEAEATANLGSWTSALNVHFNVGWFRCEANGTGCVAIDGTDDRTYRVRYADVDHRIKLLVTAVSDEGNGTAWAAATDVITR